MDAIARAVTIYLFLLILFRLAGRRSLSSMTAFDFVLLLIIGESTQQALLGNDFSITDALIVISTLIVLDIALGMSKRSFPLLGRIVDGVPMILVEHGRPLEERMRHARVSVDEVMHAARESQGLERIDQVRFAVLEISGGISIIPEKSVE